MDARREIRFGEFQMWPDERQLRRSDEPVHLTPKVFETLVLLTEKPGQVVTKQELMDRLWPDSYVLESNLNWNIHGLRRALGDDRRKKRYIETVPKLGYRFVAEIQESGEENDLAIQVAAEQPPPPEPQRERSRLFRGVVGRGETFRVLRERLEAASHGAGSMVALHGEPGIGKSTVVDAFLLESRTDAQPFQIAPGRCSRRLVKTEAYLPVMEALENLLSQDENCIAHEVLPRVAPSWCAQIAPDLLAEGEDTTRPLLATSLEHLKREFLRCMNELSTRRPVILSLEDVHWADDATTDLLAYLADRLRDSAILLITTYRDTELLLQKHPFLALKQELESHRLCFDLPLQLLSQDDIGQYLAHTFQGNDFPTALLDLTTSRTEGNPLFMVDLLRYLTQRGVIAQKDRWTLASSLAEAADGLPASVRSMVERKLDHVRPKERSVLEYASVQGSSFDSAVIGRAMSMTPVRLEEYLGRLEYVHSVIELIDDKALPDGAPSLQYRFVHSLYQDYLLNALRPSKKALICQSVAERLSTHYKECIGTVASRLGLLYETAREPARAAPLYLHAAQSAARLFASKEAVTLARSALEMTRSLPPSTQRDTLELDSLMTLVGPLTAVSGFAAPEVERAYQRARELTKSLGETSQRYSVLWGLGFYFFVRTEFRVAGEIADQLVRFPGATSEPLLAVLTAQALCSNQYWQGQFEQSERTSSHAIESYDPQLEAAIVTRFHVSSGVALHSVNALTQWMLGRPTTALASDERSNEIARTIGHPPSLVFSLSMSSWLRHYRQEPAEVSRYCEEIISIASEEGFSLWLPIAHFLLGWVRSLAISQEPRRDAIREMEASIAAYYQTGARLMHGWIQSVLADAYMRHGEFQNAESALQSGAVHADNTSERLFEPELHRLRGTLRLMRAAKELGDSSWESMTSIPETVADEACRHFEAARNVAKAQGAKILFLRAAVSEGQLWHVMNQPRRSHELVQAAYSELEEGRDTPDLEAARQLLHSTGDAPIAHE